MEKLIKKNKIILLITWFFSELICFCITNFNIASYDKNNIYIIGINIVEILYFVPIAFISLYVFFSPKAFHYILVNSIISLIIYSIILHIFIKQITCIFTNITGIINFVVYASKIYFICLPLVGFSIFTLKKGKIKKSYLLIFTKIILLFIITLILKNLLELKGILYSWPLSEFINALIFFIIYKSARFKN